MEKEIEFSPNGFCSSAENLACMCRINDSLELPTVDDTGGALILRLFKNAEVAWAKRRQILIPRKWFACVSNLAVSPGGSTNQVKRLSSIQATGQGSLFSARIFYGARSKYDCQRRWVRLYA